MRVQLETLVPQLFWPFWVLSVAATHPPRGCGVQQLVADAWVASCYAFGLPSAPPHPLCFVFSQGLAPARGSQWLNSNAEAVWSRFGPRSRQPMAKFNRRSGLGRFGQILTVLRCNSRVSLRHDPGCVSHAAAAAAAAVGWAAASEESSPRRGIESHYMPSVGRAANILRHHRP